MILSFLKNRLTANRILTLSSFLALILLTLFFIPAVIFSGNKEYISGQYLSLLFYSSSASLLIFSLTFIATLLLPEKLCRYFAPFISYLALSSFVMGFYLSPMIANVGLIDGQNNTFIFNSTYIALEIVASICLLIGLTVYYSKIRKLLQDTIGIIVILTLGFSGYIAYSDFQANKQTEINTSSREDFFRLSETENVLVFLIDTYSSDFLIALLEEDPKLAERLDGFTFFRDMLSVSPTTYLAMPSIHSGQYLDPSQSVLSSYSEHVGQQSFLSKMADGGAQSILLNRVITCPRQVSCIKASDILLNGKTAKLLDWRLLIDISLFRLLPYSLKPFIFNDGDWYFYHKIQIANPLQIDGFRDNQVLAEFKDNMAIIEGVQPQVKFFHLYSTHYQFVFNPNCNVIETDGYTPYLAMNAARCALYRFVDILDGLKNLGLYDSSLIAVISDHGIGYKVLENTESIDLNDALQFQAKSALTQIQIDNLPLNRNNASPIFIIKEPNARGELVVDLDHAASLMDIPSTLCHYTPLCNIDNDDGLNAFQAPTAKDRTRLYNDYLWQAWFWGSADLKDHVTKKEIDYSLINSNNPLGSSREIFDFSTERVSFAGFGPIQSWGRWNNGYEASLSICFADISSTESVDLIFKVRPFLNSDNPRQRVSIRANGLIITEEVYRPNNNSPDIYYDLHAPLSEVTLDPLACVNLVFNLPDATIPNINTPDDTRLLALGFSTLRIENL